MDMIEKSVLRCIKQLRRPVFTTFELSKLCGKALSTMIQTLNHLEKQGLVFKVYHDIWAETGRSGISVFTVVPFLFPKNRAYVSFVSALHYHGIVEQVPQVVTLAATGRTRIIKTRIGTYSVHRIHPSFFKGFSLDKTKSFLIAEPEKALIDSLYLSAHGAKHSEHFPELHLSESFSIRKAREWIMKIKIARTRIHVSERFESIIR
jgi:predicted transcriptional regulator of viral defense system